MSSSNLDAGDCFPFQRRRQNSDIREKLCLILKKNTFHDLVRSYDALNIEVIDPKINSRFYLDLKEAMTYIFACTQWLNTLSSSP